MEIFLVINKANAHVFGAYDTKDKAIRCCVNLNQVGNYYIERVGLR